MELGGFIPTSDNMHITVARYKSVKESARLSLSGNPELAIDRLLKYGSSVGNNTPLIHIFTV